MKEFFARLNPTERRFVVGVIVLFFIVINLVWVWPHFSDWNATKIRMKTASEKLVLFENGTKLIPGLQKEIEKYQKQGEVVPAEDQALQFVRLIQNEASKSGIIPQSMSGQRPAGATNNQFFMEQNETISLQSSEKQLVDFLYRLGSGSSLIRVKVLSVQPDQSHQQLTTRATLVASYQKKAVVPSRTATPTAAPAAAGAPKPAPAPVPAAAPKPAVAPIKPGQTNRVVPMLPPPSAAPKSPTPIKK